MRRLLVAAIALLLALAMSPVGTAMAGGPPATFTTVNTFVDGTGHCKNGPADATTVVNCNIYDGKEFVWLNGGPDNAALADGTYFFAVLVPGGQHDPNERAAKNLSDTAALPAGTPGGGDSRADRTFGVSGGTITNLGTHDFANNMLRLMPYDNTTNEGGVYILAICAISSPSQATVDPRDCKYDAFKIQEANAPVTVQAVLSGTKYLDANHDGHLDPGETGLENWSITIDGPGGATVQTDVAGDWTFTTPAVLLGSGNTTYTISEVQQSGYAQTGNTANQSSTSGGVGVTLANKMYTVTVPNDGTGSASGLNFGNIPLARGLTGTKTAIPAFTRTFAWDIAKAADKTTITIANGGSASFNYTVTATHNQGTDSAWALSGALTVTNPNGTAANVTITDSIGATACTIANGGAATIPANGSADVAYSCTFSTAQSGTQTNTATISWADQFLGATLLQAGSTTATKTFTWGDPSTIVEGSLTVTDPNAPNGGGLGTVSYTDPSPTDLKYAHTFSGDPAGTCTTHDNTATSTTSTTQTTDTASARVQVCVGKDLTVAKRVVPAFARAYNWTIGKSVDKTLVRALNGTVTFTYTVVASETGFADSAWAATGTITVSNANDFEAISLTGIGDLATGGNCAVTDSLPISVAASGSQTLHYTCSFTSGASTSNTATVTWDKDAASTPTGSASDTKSVTFETPTTFTDETSTFTDTFSGTTTTLGSLTASVGLALVSAPFSYSHTVAVPAHDCVSYTNTATFTTNDTLTTGSASRTVQVCRIPPQTGALTMGFWQNKNGQVIITGGASTLSVCNSGTWLRQFAPFQDLSTAATCAQVGTYATNVIKAASAAGDSMNPMLKAQMLATALDVYFSDPTLGGNLINAPTPVGARNIDLLNVCADAVSCSSYENASSAFNGASALTVGQMLTYAASQSIVGGSMWYGNVKPTQELAKDAFDAINNQVALQAP